MPLGMTSRSASTDGLRDFRRSACACVRLVAFGLSIEPVKNKENKIQKSYHLMYTISTPTSPLLARATSPTSMPFA